MDLSLLDKLLIYKIFLVQLERASRNWQALLRNYLQRYEMQININLTLQKNNEIINSLSRAGFELASSAGQANCGW